MTVFNMRRRTLDKIEIGGFLHLFNRKGYVLDFSTNDFDAFTWDSVGVALCQKYQLSKGKSLVAFCEEAPMEQIEKLLFDLLTYYEFYYIDRYGESKYRSVYERCKKVFDKEKNTVKVETPAIVLVNREYIKDISTRAIRDVESMEYDSAITKCRTLLEEAFCYVIENKGEEPSDKGNIKKLYKQVKDLYNMHTDSGIDKRINELLSGLEKIIDAIAEMRNKNSDAHGVGQKRIAISEHHARLFVNSSMILADFILSVGQNRSERELEEKLILH